MPDPKLKKLLMTIRAALIMASKAIEEYCREEAVITVNAETATLST